MKKKKNKEPVRWPVAFSELASVSGVLRSSSHQPGERVIRRCGLLLLLVVVVVLAWWYQVLVSDAMNVSVGSGRDRHHGLRGDGSRDVVKRSLQASIG